jgi:hypothetical protein
MSGEIKESSLMERKEISEKKIESKGEIKKDKEFEKLEKQEKIKSLEGAIERCNDALAKIKALEEMGLSSKKTLEEINESIESDKKSLEEELEKCSKEEADELEEPEKNEEKYSEEFPSEIIEKVQEKVHNRIEILGRDKLETLEAEKEKDESAITKEISEVTSFKQLYEVINRLGTIESSLDSKIVFSSKEMIERIEDFRANAGKLEESIKDPNFMAYANKFGIKDKVLELVREEIGKNTEGLENRERDKIAGGMEKIVGALNKNPKVKEILEDLNTKDEYLNTLKEFYDGLNHSDNFGEFVRKGEDKSLGEQSYKYLENLAAALAELVENREKELGVKIEKTENFKELSEVLKEEKIIFDVKNGEIYAADQIIEKINEVRNGKTDSGSIPEIANIRKHADYLKKKEETEEEKLAN